MSVCGVDLHWMEHGNGRPLVVLHGLADSHQSWRLVSAELGRRFRVYALDLPGCGLSGRPDASYCLDYHARLTAAWLDQVDLRSVDVVGHSYGGGVALSLLLYRASAVRRLALVAPGGLGSEVSLLLRLAAVFGGLEAGAELLMAPIMRLLVRVCGQRLSTEDQHAIYQLNRSPGTARAFVRTLRDVIDWRGQRRHLMHRLHEVAELPAIALFWGEQDRVIPVRHGLELCEQLENCSFWLLPGAGHFLQWEAPCELATALREYLDAPRLERAGLGLPRAVGHRRPPEDTSSLRWEVAEPRTDPQRFAIESRSNIDHQQANALQRPPTAKGAENANQHPEEWVTGDAPMTEAQASLLQTLCEEAREPIDRGLSRAEASQRIEALHRKAGRGHPKRILEEDQTDG